jgi:hypothetical protein
LRGDLVDGVRFPRALGDVEARELVVEAAIASILREIFDDCVDHLEVGGPKRIEQTADIGDAGRGSRTQALTLLAQDR